MEFKDEIHPWILESNELESAHLLMDDYQIPRCDKNGFPYLLFERISKAIDNVHHGRY